MTLGSFSQTAFANMRLATNSVSLAKTLCGRQQIALLTLARMLPWNAIERLRDHFGDYVIVVTCRHCRHSRELTPAFVARRCRHGWDEPIAGLIARFRCRCGKKLVDVQIGFNNKPRGWVKNPS
jgi:hypothetical protein